jgi:surfactin synthase thioesterase subunit/acyl carrier protein
VVVNSLNGEFIPRSLDVLRPGGTFIEIGKLGTWSRQQVAEYRPDVRYCQFDLLEVEKRSPATISSLLQRIERGLHDAEFAAIPFRAFPIEEIGLAFRHLASGRHIGKVIVEMPRLPPPDKDDSPFDAHGSYLITGAYGELGLDLALWAVDNNCQHLILLGRSAPDAKTLDRIEEIARRGCKVEVHVGDVADAAVVAGLLGGSDCGNRPPLQGIFHLAGVTMDAGLLSCSKQHFLDVFRPKIDGLWNLHRATEHLQIDTFVCFSSASSLLGPRGQANYAAANSYMDGLSAYRRARGLPASSINWGPLGKIGVSAGKAPALESYLLRSGLRMTQARECFALLKEYLRRAEQQVLVLPLDVDSFLPKLAEANEPLLATFDDIVTRSQIPVELAPVVKTMQGLSSAEAMPMVIVEIKSQVAQALSLEGTKLDNADSLIDLGIDSLLAMEIEEKLESTFGVALRDMLALQSSSIIELAEMICNKLAQAGRLTGTSAGEGTPPRGHTNGAAAGIRGKRNRAIQLFCFHHLGGAASVYREWVKIAPDTIEVCPVEMPGRETRLRDACITDFDQLLAELGEEINKKIDGPFALYGHSMGGLVAYEMSRHLEEQYQRNAVHLFVGGLWAPHNHFGALQQKSFSVSSAIRVADIPPAVTGDPDAMRRLNHIFEADATLFQSYKWVERSKLRSPISVFGGDQDTVASESDLLEWKCCTTEEFAIRIVPGDHLFIRDSARLVMEAICADVQLLQ